MMHNEIVQARNIDRALEILGDEKIAEEVMAEVKAIEEESPRGDLYFERLSAATDRAQRTIYRLIARK